MTLEEAEYTHLSVRWLCSVCKRCTAFDGVDMLSVMTHVSLPFPYTSGQEVSHKEVNRRSHLVNIQGLISSFHFAIVGCYGVSHQRNKENLKYHNSNSYVYTQAEKPAQRGLHEICDSGYI